LRPPPMVARSARDRCRRAKRRRSGWRAERGALAFGPALGRIGEDALAELRAQRVGPPERLRT
jgi:hypothetical protein